MAGKIDRILVVDDDPQNIHILINGLQTQFEIICARDGKTALEIVFSGKPPDLILLDIMMPGMDGYEVCSRLKADAATWDIPIIFLTALGQEVDEARSLNLGAVDFITKPFSLPIVEARIKAALRLKAEMDEKIILARKLEELNKELEDRVKEKTAALKRAHEDLQISEKKYRSIFENALEGIFQSSLEGRFLSANPAMARILGYPSAEDLLSYVTDIRQQMYVHAEERDALLRLLEDRRAVIGHELQFYKKSRQVIWVSLSVHLVRDETGGLPFLEGFLSDITERKRSEEEKERLDAQFRQAQKMEAVGRLAGGVAHDFNNMLSVIMGYTELSLAGLKSYDPMHARLKQVLSAASRSAELTQQLLAFSRKQTIAPKTIDINHQTKEMERLLRRIIGEDVDLVFELSENLWPVHMDPSQIGQILANLAVNSRDAMPDGGKLTVETANTTLDGDYCVRHAGFLPGEFVMLAVSDTGCGMDKETLEHAFEPFFTTKPEGKGTGLGLAMVYGIAKQNSGFVHIYSEAGEGTTLRIYIPRHMGEDTARPIAPEEGSRPRSRGETVLLVEDDTQVRLLAKEMLEELGYKVLEALGPGEAIALCEKYTQEIHLLMTDVVMPNMNGKELEARIKGMKPGVRTLFMSGYTANTIAHRGVLEKSAHFLQKPFSMDALARKVREALAAPLAG